MRLHGVRARAVMMMSATRREDVATLAHFDVTRDLEQLLRECDDPSALRRWFTLSEADHLQGDSDEELGWHAEPSADRLKKLLLFFDRGRALFCE